MSEKKTRCSTSPYTEKVHTKTETQQHIMDLLGLCLRSTYFTFRGKFYEQVEGAAIGSPISPIVANLYMEDFETRAIQSSPNPPLL